jgi:DNA polymerase III subunit beta
MKIIIDKNIILQPISKVVSITEKRSLMPILSNILIHFKKDNATVYSTDLEVSAITRIECSVENEKKVVVHGRKFLEILKELDSGDITINIDENIMSIKQKKTEITLSLQDPEEFPETKEIEVKEEFLIKGKQLIEMIEKVGFAVSVDETRYILTGMFMKGIEGEIAVVGTDGFRMALYKKKMKEIKGFQGITIPKRSILEIEKVIDDEDEVKISIDEKHVQLSTEKIRIISRIIEGSFPDYENVLPAGNTNIATVLREDLLKGLKKVSSIIGRSEPVKVSFEDKSMIIEAESDIGRAKEIIDITYTGEETNMNFNVRFLLDVVTHTFGETLTISAPKEYGAVLFRGEDGEEYKNIVMPIRI